MGTSSLFALSQEVARQSERSDLTVETEEDFDSQLEILKSAEAVGDVCWVWDWKEQKTLYMSPRYEEIWGRPRGLLFEETEDWHTAIHPEDRIRVEMAFVSLAPKDLYQEAYRIICPGGVVRWIQDRAIAIRDRYGKVRHIAGVSRDITCPA